jgi:hypothetical protein
MEKENLENFNDRQKDAYLKLKTSKKTKTHRKGDLQ